jgi:UTP--glucose-1-phosphate uridylyltransferase
VAITDAVVPVAGLGTRLLPVTRAVPKELLPVGRLPVVQHVVEELRDAGVRRVLFVTAPQKAAIERHFAGAAESAGLELYYTDQPEPLGLGDALTHGAAFAGGAPVAVALGDCLLGDGRARSDVIVRLGAALEAHDAVAAVAVEEVATEAVSRYGIVDSEDSGDVLLLRGIVEKPSPAQAPSRLAVAARYVLGPEVFAQLQDTPPGLGGEVQLTDALAALIAAGRRVVAVRLRADERRHDVGNLADYARSFCEVALADPELGPAVRHCFDARD